MRLIKFAKTTDAEATAANLRKVRAKLRVQPVKRTDAPRLYAMRKVLAELAYLQTARDRAAQILASCGERTSRRRVS